MRWFAMFLAAVLVTAAQARELPLTGQYEVAQHMGGGVFNRGPLVQPAATGGDPTTGLIPSDRDFYLNWSKAGLLSQSSIPSSTTQCGSTLTPLGGTSDDTTQINSAISACSVSSCPSGKFIDLGSGTFLINASGNQVNLNKCIVLRGQGPGVTILHSSNGATSNSPNNGAHSAAIIRAGGSGSITQTTNLTADVAQGATSITVASATGFVVGGLVLVDELANGTAMPDCCFNGSTTTNLATATGSSISGTALTLGTVTSGTVAIGQIVKGAGVSTNPPTSIVSGSGTSWTITPSQSVGSFTATFGPSVWASPDYRVMWNIHVPTVTFYDSACVGYANGNNWTLPCETNGDECAYSIRCGGVNEELHVITGVSGTTISFDSPLTLPYRTANTAQARLYPAASMVQFAGVENLTMSNGDEGNLVFSACMYCWAYKTESTQWLNAGGYAFYNAAFRNQVEFSWVHNAAWPVNGGGGYAVNSTFGSSENLFWNNIDMLANKVDVVRASGSGTVFAYNYMDDGYINGQDNWVETGMNCSHLAGSHGCLFEGNLTWNSDNDVTHGSIGHVTFFRNQMTGLREPFTALDGTSVNDATQSPTATGPLRAVGDHFMSYWDSFVGNVAGRSGFTYTSWSQRCAVGNADFGCAPVMFNIGWNDTSVSGSTADALMALSYNAAYTGTLIGAAGSFATPPTPVLEGNWDYKSSAIQWNAASTHTIPSSFFLSSAPAFFGPGASATYPYPQVTPTAGTAIQLNSLGGSGLPAKARWDAGTPFVQP